MAVTPEQKKSNARLGRVYIVLQPGDLQPTVDDGKSHAAFHQIKRILTKLFKTPAAENS